jgi:ribonuclease PH
MGKIVIDNKLNILEVGLVSGRHELPVSKYIFDSIEDVLDFDSLEKRAIDFFKSISTDVDVVTVYVTGLTAATVAVINAYLRLKSVALIFNHYNRDTDSWVSQPIEFPMEFNGDFRRASYGI